MDKILIIDFGSQYTQLIARRVRELCVYCEIIPHDAKIEKISAFCPTGIIFLEDLTQSMKTKLQMSVLLFLN